MMAYEKSTVPGPILFLVSSMQTGGAERVASLLCNRWATHGIDVILVPTFSGRGECHFPLHDRVKLEFLSDRVGDASSTIAGRLLRLRELRGLVRQSAPSIIISFLTHVNIAALIAVVGIDIPVVVAERSYPPEMPVGRLLAALRKRLYRRAAVVVMQTNEGRQWLEGNCAGARSEVIPNPVEFPVPKSGAGINPSNIVAAGRHIVLAVGRLGAEKRFDELLRSFAAVVPRHPEWDLVVLGEGPERQRLENLRVELSLDDRAHFPGRAGNLADWYRRAQIFALTSRFEGFPNALLEAMAHGLASVSVDCRTGPRDIIRTGVDGILVDKAGGREAFTAALTGLMSSPEQRKRLSEQAKNVRSRFSLDVVGRQWDELLCRLAS